MIALNVEFSAVLILTILPVFFEMALLNEQILKQSRCFQFFYLPHNLLDVLINLTYV